MRRGRGGLKREGERDGRDGGVDEGIKGKAKRRNTTREVARYFPHRARRL